MKERVLPARALEIASTPPSRVYLLREDCEDPKSAVTAVLMEWLGEGEYLELEIPLVAPLQAEWMWKAGAGNYVHVDVPLLPFQPTPPPATGAVELGGDGDVTLPPARVLSRSVLKREAVQRQPRYIAPGDEEITQKLGELVGHLRPKAAPAAAVCKRCGHVEALHRPECIAEIPTDAAGCDCEEFVAGTGEAR